MERTETGQEKARSDKRNLQANVAVLIEKKEKRKGTREIWNYEIWSE